MEFLRQLKRRRTGLALASAIGLPVLIVVILAIAGAPTGEDSSGDFVSVATSSGLNAATFVLAATSQFLLVLIVALFAGDSVASEAQWGSLRYLLLRPLARGRLLRVKLSVAVLFSVAASVLLPLAGLAAGTLAFGWSGLVSPVGGGLPAGTGLLRLAYAVLYVTVSMGVVVGLAFMLSTFTDAPLAAVGGAAVLTVLSQVFDSISALGVVRSFLPTHYWFSWTDLFADPVSTGAIGRGLLLCVPWTVVPILVSYWHFLRKDILS